MRQEPIVEAINLDQRLLEFFAVPVKVDATPDLELFPGAGRSAKADDTPIADRNAIPYAINTRGEL
jgi:hypothetical protein